MVKVSFVVSAPCLPEDQLKIVGSHSALGCWDPLRGLLLNMATLDEWHGSVTIEKSTYYMM